MDNRKNLIEDVDKILKEESPKLPFNKSQYQIENFTPGKFGTARRIRQTILEMRQIRNKLNEAKKNRRLCDIRLKKNKNRIDELHQKIILSEKKNKILCILNKLPILNWFIKLYNTNNIFLQIEKIEAENISLEYQLDMEISLIEDTLYELNQWKSEYDKLPKLKNRQEYENEEKDQWVKRLLFEAKCQYLYEGRVNYTHLMALSDAGLPPECIQFTEGSLGLLEFDKTKLDEFKTKVALLEQKKSS